MHLRTRRRDLRLPAVLMAALAAADAPATSAPADPRDPAVHATDGAWVPVPPPSARSRHALVLDSARNRLVLFGGFDGAFRNDVWVLDLAGTAAWRPLEVSGPAPAPRSAHAAIYDPVRDRVIIHGGTAESGYFGDLWSLDLSPAPAWSPLSVQGPAPSARLGHSALYDPAGDRMIVFGGDDGGVSVLNDAWALDLAGAARWTSLNTSGTPPPPRFNHTAVLDPARGRMVVFGGTDGATPLGDAAALDLATGAWSALAPAGSPPAPREGHVAAWDAAGDRMVVCGGRTAAGASAEAWILSGGAAPAWTPWVPAGTPPAARAHAAAAPDPLRGGLVLFGGEDGGRFADTRELSLGESPAWSDLAPHVAPTARFRHVLVARAAPGRAVLFGGLDGAHADPTPAGAWSFSLVDGVTWTPVAAPAPEPAGRTGAAAALDAARGRMVLFGGHDGSAARNDTWALALGDASAWTPLAPAGTPPSGRQNHSLVLDPRRDRAIVFGGFDVARRNDVWALDLAAGGAWSPLAPVGTPPTPRSNHVAVLDPVRDRMIVIGGSDGAFRNDVWALSLGDPPAWTALSPAGTPPSARVGHVAAYDPVRDRIVLFGGDDLAYRNDAWALSLGPSPAWTALAPAGAAPPGRRFHAAAWDGAGDRLLIHGGWNGDYRDDAAFLAWGAPSRPWVAWDAPAPAAPGGAARVAFALRHALDGPRAVEWALDGARDWPGFPAHGVAVAGAAAAESVAVAITVPDTAAQGLCALTLRVWLSGAPGHDSVTSIPLVVLPGTLDAAPGATPFRAGRVLPNPASNAARLILWLPAPAAASLEIFDVRGRRVLAPRERELPAGVATLGFDAAGLPPGVYLARVRCGTAEHRARFVVAR
uniref:T9SS type A sorting domain-containing protein n=1 Tax=Eiseniibacteriota bacterium TaxID=2212470 RepID=A0A832IA22_UNCEI